MGFNSGFKGLSTFMLSCLQDSDANSIYKQMYFQNIFEEKGEVL